MTAPARGPDREGGPLGPFAIATIVTCLLFVLAGIGAPDAAAALLRLLVATLAIGYVAARVYEARLPAKMTHDVYAPFDDPAATRSPSAAPAGLRELAAQLEAADRGRSARRSEIPRAIRWRLIDEAARRLADHHGLSLSDPSHHRAIRSLVAEPAWSLIDPGRAASQTRPAATRKPRVVTLSQLPMILDTLEGL